MIDEKKWNIRTAKENDAEQIRELFVKGYQGGYPYISFLDLESLIKSINSKDIDVLVIDYKDSVVGTGAVLYNNHRAELGRAVIDPEYRGILKTTEGTSAFGELVKYRIDLALKKGAGIIHSTGVAGHPKTQAALDRFDFKHLVLELGKYYSLYKKDHREISFEMVYKNSPLIINFFQNKERIISIPKDSQAVVKRNLDELNIEAKIISDSSKQSTAKISSVNYDAISNHLLISVSQGDYKVSDIIDEIYSLRKSYNSEYEMIKVATNDNIAIEIYDKLKREEFYTSGFLPAWLNSENSIDDAVVFSNLNSQSRMNSKTYLLGNSESLNTAVLESFPANNQEDKK